MVLDKKSEKILKHKKDIYMRQHWNDHRFNLTEFTNQTARVEEAALDTLWIPDLFFNYGMGGSRFHIGL